MYGSELYRRLAAETGVDPSWHEVGSLRLASSPERLEELRRQAGWAKTFGLPLELIGPDDAKALFPLMSTEGVLGAVYLPTDGWLDPSGLAQALAAGARSRGASIRPHTRVVAIGAERGRVTGVTVEHQGEREEIARRCRRQCRRDVRPRDRCDGRRDRPAHPDGAPVPLHRGDRRRPSWPAPAARPRQPRVLPRGGRRPVHGRLRARSGAMGARRHPARLQRQATGARHAALRIDHGRSDPAGPGDGGRAVSAGSSTAPRRSRRTTSSSSVSRTSAGSGSRPGSRRTASPAPAASAGRWRAGSSRANPSSTSGRWTSGGSGRRTGRAAYTLARSIENYATYYDIHYPNEERLAGRPLRTSPTYDVLAGLGRGLRREVRLGAPELVRAQCRRPALRRARGAGGACDRVAGRASTGRRRSPRRPSRPGAAAALFDETSFAKLEVVGPGACAFLQGVAGNDIDRAVGSIVYTQLLDRRGGIQADLTVTRLAPERFLLVTGTAFGNHDARVAARRCCPTTAQRRSATSPRPGCASVCGVRARATSWQPLTRDDVSDAGFPYLTAREIDRGLRAAARPARHVRRRAGLGALRADRVRPGAVGRALGGGSRARPGRRRLPRDRCAPPREGLPRLVERHHPRRDAVRGGARVRGRARQGRVPAGAEALLAAKAAGPRKRLRCLVLDDPLAVALGNEPVRVDGEVVGRVTSGGYGFAVERSIAYAYLPPDRAAIGTRGEIEVFGEWIGFEVAREPLYDPDNARIRS